MTQRIGLLTAGSDCSGLNAAIRAIGKTATGVYEMEVLGFQDGFTGLIHDRAVPLAGPAFSGILTAGGTCLGASRDTPADPDRLAAAVRTYERRRLDALICIGGRETQTAAHALAAQGLRLITLPKAIDNDVAGTDAAIGFDTALEVAAESIDRLHSTAHSSHRIIIVELMGRNTGWLPLGAGIAGGADVILIPEIPYSMDRVAAAIQRRQAAGKRFSLVTVAERISSQEQAAFHERLRQTNARTRPQSEQQVVETRLRRIENRRSDSTFHVANRLTEATGLETRITILGYLLRGGVPSAGDRILATRLGTAAVDWAAAGQGGVMAALQGGQIIPHPLTAAAGSHRPAPLDHAWIESARRLGVELGG